MGEERTVTTNVTMKVKHKQERKNPTENEGIEERNEGIEETETN